MKRRDFLAGVSAIFGSVMFPSVSASETDERVITLTFDDGPKPDRLPPLLELLGKEKIQATFFVVGHKAKNRPELLRRIAAENHEIANHSYTHDRLDQKSVTKSVEWVFQNEILATEKVLADILGFSPAKHFRPPFWMMTGELENRLRAGGYITHHLGSVVDAKTVFTKPKFFDTGIPENLRDINSLDYEYAETSKNPDKRNNARAIATHLTRTLRYREARGIYRHIIAMHELYVSAASLKLLIPEWKNRGYAFSLISKQYGPAQKKGDNP